MLSDTGRIPDLTRYSRRADAEGRGAAKRCWTIRAHTTRATRMALVGATATARPVKPRVVRLAMDDGTRCPRDSSNDGAE